MCLNSDISRMKLLSYRDTRTTKTNSKTRTFRLASMLLTSRLVCHLGWMTDMPDYIYSVLNLVFFSKKRPGWICSSSWLSNSVSAYRTPLFFCGVLGRTLSCIFEFRTTNNFQCRVIYSDGRYCVANPSRYCTCG